MPKNLNPNQIKTIYPKVSGGWSLTQFPPSEIMDLSVIEGSTKSILHWSALTDAKSIEIWRRNLTTSGDYVLVRTLFGTESEFVDYDLVPETEYEWEVRATNDQGSTSSNSVIRTTQADTGTQITITGTGFGLEPNVVFYRTLKEGVDGNPIQFEPPAGEIGSFHSGTMIYDTIKGKKCLIGFDGEEQLRASVEFRTADATEPDAIQSFNWFTEQMTPPRSVFVGSDTNKLETFSNRSDSKSIWFLGDEGATSTDSLPDMAAPQHGGDGQLYIWGNAINYGIRVFGQDKYDFWDWNGSRLDALET